MRTYNEQQLFAAKTVCGGIYHSLRTYNKRDIFDDHWSQLCGYLGIDKSAIYSVEEVTEKTFLITSRDFTFRYHHDDWSHDRRIIEFIK